MKVLKDHIKFNQSILFLLWLFQFILIFWFIIWINKSMMQSLTRCHCCSNYCPRHRNYQTYRIYEGSHTNVIDKESYVYQWRNNPKQYKLSFTCHAEIIYQNNEKTESACSNKPSVKKGNHISYDSSHRGAD